MKINSEIGEKIKILYIQKTSCYKIAQQLGLKRESVAKYLIRNNIELVLKKNKPPLLKEVQLKICEEYPKLNTVELGKKYGVSFSTITKILKRHGKIIQRSQFLKHKQDFIVTSYQFKEAEKAAALRGFSFNVSLEFLSRLFENQKRRCAYSGTPLSVRQFYGDNSANASLDRINNRLGYEEDNVQWVDKRINMMKGTLSHEDFVAICTSISKHIN